MFFLVANKKKLIKKHNATVLPNVLDSAVDAVTDAVVDVAIDAAVTEAMDTVEAEEPIIAFDNIYQGAFVEIININKYHGKHKNTKA